MLSRKEAREIIIKATARLMLPFIVVEIEKQLDGTKWDFSALPSLGGRE